LANAAGKDLADEQIGKIATYIESSDSSMFTDGRAFNHKTGKPSSTNWRLPPTVEMHFSLRKQPRGPRC
jgi:uncharacterized protein involved in propanediol utilization